MATPLLVHIHVPKCAGTTVENHLINQLGRDRVWIAPKRTRKFPLDLFTHKYSRKLPERHDEIKAISGHFIGKSAENLFPDRRIVRSIILREPESMMLSYYNYRMMRYLTAGQHAYSFSLFLRATRVNPVAHFLLERWLEMPWAQLVRLSDERKAELLNEVLGSIDYVADIREADSLIKSISAEIGISPQAQRRNSAEEHQAMTDWQIVRLGDLSATDRALLKSRTALDHYLWSRWVRKEMKPFDSRAQTSFVLSEFVRPKYQVERRIARRFGLTLAGTK